MFKATSAFIFTVLFFYVSSVWGSCVIDDREREVCSNAPVTRIAALSPGATELAFAAGAGSKVVAVVSFSDYPPAAQEIESVGSPSRLDLERLLALKPDLILAWGTGNPSEQISTLLRLGMRVFYVEPHSFSSIAQDIRDIAQLAGTEASGDVAASAFLKGISDLKTQYSQKPKIRTFYQVWDEPLMTMNGQHYINQVVELCGGINVFSKSPRLIPRLNKEAVLIENPEVIVAGGMGERNAHWLEWWRAFPELMATKQDNLFFVPPSLLQRPTPRLLEGAKILCEKLDLARSRRG
ncbi:cobalamin-binding protein [Marinomonas communis]|uniref:cobalamin-binding protein n=1 Tax=Marinomonas communis TaxID=28254 RepID=UPI001D18D195|nr:cobalamin-binding protein [Marinomonas communis]MCC4275404.1 cobalamin-binding protein [Marinomonas communis]